MTNKAKYESRNPAKRFLLRRFLRVVKSKVDEEPGELLDVGVGEGLFWEGASGRRVVGLDNRTEALDEARARGIETVFGSALELPFPDESFDVVTAIEILEHLMEPEIAVREIARVSRSAAIVSVPWEPWFSLLVLAGTGTHVRRLGREPEHVQAFGPRNLEQLLAKHFDQVKVGTVFPWIVARATRPVGTS